MPVTPFLVWEEAQAIRLQKVNALFRVRLASGDGRTCKEAEAVMTGARAQSRAHGAACHLRALQIDPAMSHQPTNAKVRPKLRATAISAIRW
jgi:hypothetical protein